jgi:hypothetical protein
MSDWGPYHEAQNEKEKWDRIGRENKRLAKESKEWERRAREDDARYHAAHPSPPTSDPKTYKPAAYLGCLVIVLIALAVIIFGILWVVHAVQGLR